MIPLHGGLISFSPTSTIFHVSGGVSKAKTSFDVVKPCSKYAVNGTTLNDARKIKEKISELAIGSAKSSTETSHLSHARTETNGLTEAYLEAISPSRNRTMILLDGELISINPTSTISRVSGGILKQKTSFDVVKALYSKYTVSGTTLNDIRKEEEKASELVISLPKSSTEANHPSHGRKETGLKEAILEAILPSSDRTMIPPHGGLISISPTSTIFHVSGGVSQPKASGVEEWALGNIVVTDETGSSNSDEIIYGRTNDPSKGTFGKEVYRPKGKSTHKAKMVTDTTSSTNNRILIKSERYTGSFSDLLIEQNGVTIKDSGDKFSGSHSSTAVQEMTMVEKPLT
ncbi:unnamed protein product, partial [Strongylus vulgaris]